MAIINRHQIEAFLVEIGERCEPESTLFLLGGGALEMLGGTRPTLDLDYVGDDVRPNKLQRLMMQIAEKMHIELEAVPITEFVPLAKDADKRALLVGIFGHLTVFIFDPYTIALSKLDRGFDTDLEDIIFLIQSDLVAIDQLEDYVRLIVPMANQYDLDLGEMHRHLQVIRRSL